MLIDGVGGCACGECLAEGLAVADRDMPPGDDGFSYLLLALQARLNQATQEANRAEAVRLIRAALELHCGAADQLRHLCHAALDSADFEGALRAQDRIPAEQATTGDRLSATLAALRNGDYHRCAQPLEWLEAAKVDDAHRAMAMLFRTELTLRMDPQAGDWVEAQLEALERATTLLEKYADRSLGDEDGEGYREAKSLMRNAKGLEAECLLRMGDDQGATRILDELEQTGPLQSRERLLRGDVLAAQGLVDEARERWRNVVDDPTSGPADQRAAHERLGSPYR